MGTQAKHTPLPWKVDFADEPHWPIGYAPGYPVCRMVRGPVGADGEDRANAAFIVRACNAHDDLLAAAKMAVKREGDYLGALDAAIAKAEA